MKGVRRICSWIAGTVLFLAGFLKLMDPVGAGLVVGEYYKFLHISFLAPTAAFAGVALAFFETLVGAAMITGIRQRLTAAVSGVMLGFFTVLTFIMWRVNPDMDCGCFGEAVHLSHMQSLLKNLVLCVLWAGAFLPFRSLGSPDRIKSVSFSITVLSVLAFTVYSLVSIPAMDFTPFKPGVTLMQARQDPDADAPLLSICCDEDGEYCDWMLAKGPAVVVSAYDPDRIGASRAAALREFAGSLDGIAPTFFVFAGECPELPDSYSADRRTLLTLNRSNGGVTLLSDGVVIAKWPSRSLPDRDHVAELLGQDPAEAMMKENTPKRLRLQGFLLYVFAVLLLL